MLSIIDSSCPVTRAMPTRRELLRIGGLALGGLSLGGPALPGLLEQATAAERRGVQTNKSVVLLFLQGGPPQMETFDPKLDVPDNIRSCTGELRTKLPGVWFGGNFPKLAERANRLAVVRSYGAGEQNHEQYVALNGESPFKATMGAVAARGKGGLNSKSGIPNHVLVIPETIDPKLKLETRISDVFSLNYVLQHYGAAGSLGRPYEAFVPRGGSTVLDNLTLQIPGDRFQDRRVLLQQFDELRRSLDRVPDFASAGALRQQAYGVLERGIAAAFDLSNEDPRTIARYDTSHLFDMADYHVGGKNYRNKMNQSRITNLLGRQLLMARRLCEAGCGFATVVDAGWDLHGDGNNPNTPDGMAILGPQLDHAVAAFLDDVHERGLSDQILLVITGEMGRSPTKTTVAQGEGTTSFGGTGHWKDLTPLVFAGGGLKMGQVIGQTDRTASRSLSAPYIPANLLATILHTVFDASQARIQPDVLPAEITKLVLDGKPIAGLM
ncbi:MAG: DUF1501 domain-containing protein [Pirellulaceae bacterium]